MVAIIDMDSDAMMSLDDYMAFVADEVDVLDIEDVIESCWALRRLANERDFVLDKVHEKLMSYWDMRDEPLSVPKSRSLPQSIILATHPDFYVRANVWLPLAGDTRKGSGARSLYSYDIAHDHNYHLATVGYYGPGYVTELFEYDHYAVDGYWGEALHLPERGEYQLTPGRVMVYEAGVDVHIQRPPDDISVSLNLMCTPFEHVLWQQQYIFDARRKKIIGGSGDRTSERLFLLDIVKHVHNANSVQLLEDFVTGHPCPRTKAQALAALETICPAEIEHFRSKADPDVIHLSSLDLAHGSDAGYVH